MQVASVIARPLNLPDWFEALVLMLLAIGFPIAIVLAWAFEMTPEGIKPARGTRPAPESRKSSFVDYGLIAALLLVAAATFWNRQLPQQQIEAADLSIAVLPFEDMSAEGDQQYFTDGLSEELLNLLASVDELRVASRTSSFVYRDPVQPIPEIAASIGVGHILEGSMRKDGDRIRITAQLIDAATDTHLWSETYDRNFDDIFAIQDEIANSIVSELMSEFGLPAIQGITVAHITDNLNAYEMYLVARERYIRRGQGGLSESLRLSRVAVELDPTFAKGWELIAAIEAIAEDASYGIWREGIDHPALAKEAARTALQLDPGLSMPFAVLGSLAVRYDRNVVEALTFFEDALQNDSKNSTAWLWQGLTYKYAGYMDDAIASFEQCLSIDPAYRHCRSFMAESYLFKGATEQALALHEVHGAHDFGGASPSFVSVYVRRGQRDVAIDIADRKMRSRGAPVEEWALAIENPDRDNSAGLQKLLDWTVSDDRGMELPPQMLFSFRAWDEMLDIGEMQRRMLWHPDAAEFRVMPQFKEIVRKWAYDELWRTIGFPSACRPLGEDDFICDGPVAN